MCIPSKKMDHSSRRNLGHPRILKDTHVSSTFWLRSGFGFQLRDFLVDMEVQDVGYAMPHFYKTLRIIYVLYIDIILYIYTSYVYSIQ